MREIKIAQTVFLLLQLALTAAIDPPSLTSDHFNQSTAPDKGSPPIFVITEEDIRASGAVVLGEILNGMAGLEILDKGYVETAGKVSFEGFAPNSLLYILDDEVINNPFGGSFDLNMIPLSSVEKIEVFRSPGYFEKGTRASGGTIRISTKRYDAGEPFSRLSLAGGSYQTNVLSGSFRRGLSEDKVGLSMSISNISTDGYGDNEEYSSFQYHFRADEKLWEGVDLSLSGCGTSSSLDLTGSEEVSREIETGWTSLSMKAVLMPGSSTPLEFSAFYSDNRRDSLDLSASETGSEIDGEQVVIRMKGILPVGPNLCVTAGAAEQFLKVDDIEETQTFSVFTGASYKNGRLPALSAMGRWEKEGARFSTWSGGLEASQFLNSSSSVYVSLLRAQHIPTIRERLTVEEFDKVGEESVIETGFRYRFRDLACSMALFSRRNRDDYSYMNSESGDNVASEPELRVIGWRIFSSLGVGRNLFLSLGYQKADVQESPGEEANVFVPRHHLTGVAEAHKYFRGETIRCSCRVSGLFVSGKEQGRTAVSTVDDSYRYVDTSFRIKVADLTLFYTMRNLFDSRFEVTSGGTLPGRTNRFGFSWDFHD